MPPATPTLAAPTPPTLATPAAPATPPFEHDALDRCARWALSPYGAVATATEEGRSFLRARVALCWKVGTLLTGAFLVAFLVAGGLAGRGPLLRHLIHPSVLANLGGTLVCFTGWMILRRSQLTFWLMGLVDLVIGFLLLAGYAITFAVVQPPLELRTDLVMVLVTSSIISVRAIAIPASVRHTLLVSAFVTLPSLALAGFLHWTHPLHAIHSSFAMAMVLATLMCAIPVAMAGFASRVIYGLRAEVAQAKRLGQYVLEKKLGEGGMGMVYLAHHALLRRPTAVKLLFPERVGPDALARFEREVRLTATLTHPNTVGIFDYGRTPDGVFYYAMEYLDGVDLETLVRRFGPQPPARVVHVLQQVCASLAEAHARGLVHRDIKPANIILCERGGVPDTVKVVDFGLVKDLGVLGATSSGPTLTRADAILGTPLYMAPECLRGANVDGRADLYALGAVGCFLLTGRPVFEAASVLEVCALHLNARPEAPSVRLGTPLPADLEALVLRCLGKDAAERPAGASELRRALLACAVPPWTEDDARAWWASHGGDGHPPAAVTGLDPTLPLERSV